MLVVDYGAQYAQLIARRIREAKVYSEVVPHTHTLEQLLEREPLAIVLSGGPSSVYAEGAPALDPALLDAGIPVFGMCYGFQAMVQASGGTVARTGMGEYGATRLIDLATDSTLFSGQPVEQSVWMSHGDRRDRRRPDRRLRGPLPSAVWRAVAPRGAAFDVRSAGAGELPSPGRRAHR